MILTPFDLRCPVDLFHLRIGAQCLFAPYAMKLQKSFKIRVSKYESKYTYHIYELTMIQSPSFDEVY